MDFSSDYLDNFNLNIENMDKNLYFMREQFVDFSQLDKLKQLKIRFSDCIVAMSKNGGLIAYCVKGGHFVDKVINKKIVVMFQNAVKSYSININRNWDNLKKFVICLDFTPKEDLYAILNDGKVFKVSYNLGKLKQKISPSALTETGLLSAKFFEKGFIALTKGGEFYYIKDFKNMFAIKFFTAIPPFINIDNKVDYIPIPAENTESRKIELLITKQEDDGGIISVPLKEDNENTPVVPYGETGYLEIVGISHITRETTHKLIVSSNMGSNDKDDKIKKDKKKEKGEVVIEPPKIENVGKQKEIGKICAIAISPNNEKVAFYNRNRKCAYLYNADFEGEYKVVYFDCDNSPHYEEYQKELDEALEFREGCEFLFCGEDTLALCWQRVIILSKVKAKDALVYISSEENIGKGKLVCKCITEVDGLRYFTNDGIFLISKVPKELYNIGDEFSKAVSKKLIDIYKNTLNRKYTDNKDIRSLSKDLPEAVMELQRASANIFWTDNNNEQNQKETQLFVLKVAQFMKKFVDKEEFNFLRFNQICKEMRIINNLRNDPKYPVFMTYREYVKIDPKDLISILIKFRNFQLAANISRFLDYPMKKVLNKYVMAIMKREIGYMEESIDNNSKGDEIKEKYSVLFESLEKVPGISFVKLAKKASKYGGRKLAMYLLEQEKSELVKIPMLLQLKSNFDDPLKIAFDSYDFNAVIKVMADVKKESINVLINQQLHKYFRKILLYYKIYDKGQIINFLEKTKNYVELYYLNIKTFFKQDNFENRMEAINECKSDLKTFEKYLKKLEKKNDPLKADKIELFDIKAANKFLERLEFITKFQSKCLSEEKAIIHYSEKDPFRVSVYDCFKKGFMKEESNWIEAQNKNIQYSPKKLHLIKFRSYLELKRPDAIENQLQKTPLKKLGLSPINLAEIYYDYKYYAQAARWLVQVKDLSYYDYVISLFKHMKAYKEWLEYIISNKNIEDKANLVNEVLAISPGTEKYLEEFCKNYKVNLNK